MNEKNEMRLEECENETLVSVDSKHWLDSFQTTVNSMFLLYNNISVI